MGFRGRVLTLGILLVSVLVVRNGDCFGQSYSLDFDRTPLENALYLLAEKAGVDVVFAHRFTEDKTTSCSYRGASLTAAFACLLESSGLTVAPVGDRQYVIAPEKETRAPFAESFLPARPVAQLVGRVIDDESGEPLPGANIVIPALNTGTTSAGDGSFKFSNLPPGRLTVRTTFVGYEANRQVVSTDNTVEVRLLPVALETGEVVVEGDRNTLDARSPVAGAVRVFERHSAERPSVLRSDDIFGLLRWLPAVRQSGEVGGRLAVRGAGPDQTLHILDGAPLFHPWQAMGLFSTLQTATLKDARLFSGSIPAEYGGRLSAVLATTMKDGNAVDPHIEATVGSVSSQFMAEAPLSDRLSFMIAGRRSYADGLLNSTGLGVSERTTLQNSFYSDFNAKLTARPWDGHELRLAVYSGSERMSPGENRSAIASIGWGRYLSGTPMPENRSRFQWRSRLFSLQHAYLPSSRLLLKSTAYYSGYDGMDTSGGALFAAPGQASSIDNLGARLDAHYFSASGHAFRAGLQFVRHRFDNGLTSETPDERLAASSQTNRIGPLYEAAVYFEDTWRPGSRLQVQPGLRISHFGLKSGVDVLPRITTKLTVDPDRLVVRAGVGKQVQYVHQVLDQVPYARGNAGTRWLPSGIGQIRPSSGFQANVGLESRPIRGLEIKLDGYWRSYSGVLVPTGYDVLSIAETAGHGTIGWMPGDVYPGRQRGVGTELSATYRYNGWSLWTTYVGEDLQEETTSSLGVRTFAPSRLSIPHTLRAGTSWMYGRWAAALIAEIRSGYPVAIDASTDIDPGARNGQVVPEVTTDAFGRLPAYGRIDATVGYAFELVGARWLAQLDIFNVTNRANIIGHLYDQSDSSRTVEDLKGLPRLRLLKLRVEF